MSEFYSVAKGILPVLLYDGDCAFCSSTIRYLTRFIRKPPKMTPYQWVDISEFGLTTEQCREKIQLVTAEKKIYSGSEAFAHFLIISSLPWKLFGKTLNLPGINLFARLAYYLVAKNRYRLPGGKPSCQIPNGESSP